MKNFLLPLLLLQILCLGAAAQVTRGQFDTSKLYFTPAGGIATNYYWASDLRAYTNNYNHGWMRTNPATARWEYFVNATLVATNSTATNNWRGTNGTFTATSYWAVAGSASTSAPGISTNQAAAGSNTPPVIVVAATVISGTNANPNGIYTAGKGSIFNQFDVATGTNFTAQWIKNTTSGNTGWSVTATGFSTNYFPAIATTIFTSATLTNELANIDCTNANPVTAPQRAKIQAMLDTVTNVPGLRLVVDGRYATDAPLRVRGNTLVDILPGCGFVACSNSLAPCLVNNGWNAAAGVISETNIIIRGGILNGNSFNQTSKWNTTAQNSFFGWVSCAQFDGVKNLLFDGVKFLVPKSFAMFYYNAEDVTFRSPIVDVGTSGAYNMDGLHGCGPLKNVVIRDGKFRTKDDAIAFNTDDTINPFTGFADPAYTVPLTNLVYGDTIGVLVDGVYLDNAIGGDSGIRLQSGLHRIDQLTVRNVSGATHSKTLVIGGYEYNNGNAALNGPGHYGNIVFDNFDVACLDSYYSDLLIWTPAWTNSPATPSTIDSLIFRGMKRSHYGTRFGSQPTFPYIFVEGANIRYMQWDDWVYAPTNSGGSTNCVMFVNTGNIRTLALHNNYFNSGCPTNSALYASLISGYQYANGSWNGALFGQNITNLLGSGNIIIGFTNVIGGAGATNHFNVKNNLVGYSLSLTDEQGNFTNYPIATSSGISVSTPAIATNWVLSGSWVNPTATLSNTTVSVVLTNAGVHYIYAQVDAQNTTAGEGSKISLNFSSPANLTGGWACPGYSVSQSAQYFGINTDIPASGGASTSGQYATWFLQNCQVITTNANVTVTLRLAEQSHTSGQVQLVNAFLSATQ